MHGQAVFARNGTGRRLRRGGNDVNIETGRGQVTANSVRSDGESTLPWRKPSARCDRKTDSRGLFHAQESNAYGNSVYCSQPLSVADFYGIQMVHA